jgi:hypothetical protein
MLLISMNRVHIKEKMDRKMKDTSKKYQVTKGGRRRREEREMIRGKRKQGKFKIRHLKGSFKSILKIFLP